MVTVGLDEHRPFAPAPAAGNPHVREISAEPGGLRLYVEDGSRACRRSCAMLDRDALGLTSIAVRPTLDDVFLRQTGQSLRDATAEAVA